MKKINLRNVSELLSNKEMKAIKGGDDPPVGWIGNGDAPCCYYKCWQPAGGGIYAEGVKELNPADCFDWAMNNCGSSFTVQPCPW